MSSCHSESHHRHTLVSKLVVRCGFRTPSASLDGEVVSREFGCGAHAVIQKTHIRASRCASIECASSRESILSTCQCVCRTGDHLSFSGVSDLLSVSRKQNTATSSHTAGRQLRRRSRSRVPLHVFLAATLPSFVRCRATGLFGLAYWVTGFQRMQPTPRRPTRAFYARTSCPLRLRILGMSHDAEMARLLKDIAACQGCCSTPGHAQFYAGGSGCLPATVRLCWR